MKEKYTPHLKSLQHPAIDAQYIKGKDENDLLFNDPLMEDAHEVVKGLVHKYSNRALVKVSYHCAAHCRFCTRIRQIGKPEGTLQPLDIAAIISYLQKHPEIDDVIVSGGDPLYTPQITKPLLEQLRRLESIKVLRIGSRMALQSPQSFKAPLVKELLQVIGDIADKKPFFILLHINHPAELSDESLAVIKMLRRQNVTLLSQTVFLTGINDDLPVLKELFTRIYHAGIVPYYLYHCDAVKGLERFVVPIEKEISLVSALFSHLSGIAVPRHVVDVEQGYGKLPVPQPFVDSAGTILRDFRQVETALL